VLDALSAGGTNAALATALGLSVETVKWHISQLLAESGCADREELAVWWRSHQERPAFVALLLRLLSRRATWLPGVATLVGLSVVLLVVVVGLGNGPHPSTTRADVQAVSSPSAVLHGWQDAGAFILHPGGPVAADNRVAASAVRLVPGDSVQFPTGMRWEPLPGVSATVEWALQASVTVGREKLYITVLVDGGGVRFTPVDDRTFRVTTGGTVLVTAQHRTADGGLVDHPVAVDTAGHLALSTAPVAAQTVTIYGSGQALDVSRLASTGQLPPAQASFPSEWFLTMCDGGGCAVSYRVRQLHAPVAGMVTCQHGPAFDLDTGTYVLHFRDAGTLTNNPTWRGQPGSCGVDRWVQVGDVLNEAFTHYVIRATTESGAPVSVVVAEDGSLYVGALDVAIACPPCRGS
jgi:hypothetical protein